MKMSLACFLALLSSFIGQHSTFALQDVTSDLFGSENDGTIAAFGDFNSDKQTDIFIIRKQSELVIFLADLKVPYFKPKVHLTKDAFPSFNGDMIPDIFGSVDGSLEICYFRNRQQGCEKALNTTAKMRIPHSHAFIDLNKDFTAGEHVVVHYS
ncbi:hypothetical protein DNTS_012991 [Danionella cerebrum]|uniref:Integrin alpha-2 domain-containing protein n=1 Tax=Danionella cerebrum TaxID=2873325 RepID=A0A553MU67_9TELE|nr:hypothetical protein DNTS_012991 [Danionella translucida]